MYERITSRSNRRVKALRAALLEPGADEIGVEGFHLVEEALASGIVLSAVFLREDQESRLQTIGLPQETPVFLLTRDVFDSAAATGHAQGIAALFERPEVRYRPRTGELTVLAAGLQDPGNLGTLIRSAEAFGAAAVFLGPGTVDPWNGKSLRASAGSVFRVPVLRWTDPLQSALRETGGALLAAVAKGGTPAHQISLTGSVTIAIGNEGAGVPEQILRKADGRIILPMPGRTESLNAGVAASILLYEASRQRSTGASR